MARIRPGVDTRCWDAAEELLETSNKFNALREDIRVDMKWELAADFQRAWEQFCDEQKLDD